MQCESRTYVEGAPWQHFPSSLFCIVRQSLCNMKLSEFWLMIRNKKKTCTNLIIYKVKKDHGGEEVTYVHSWEKWEQTLQSIRNKLHQNSSSLPSPLITQNRFSPSVFTLRSLQRFGTHWNTDTHTAFTCFTHTETYWWGKKPWRMPRLHQLQSPSGETLMTLCKTTCSTLCTQTASR